MQNKNIANTQLRSERNHSVPNIIYALVCDVSQLLVFHHNNLFLCYASSLTHSNRRRHARARRSTRKQMFHWLQSLTCGRSFARRAHTNSIIIVLGVHAPYLPVRAPSDDNDDADDDRTAYETTNRDICTRYVSTHTNHFTDNTHSQTAQLVARAISIECRQFVLAFSSSRL